MELWIRSQDKMHLVKADKTIHIEAFDSVNVFFIVEEVTKTENFVYGQYESKQRCIEILDEIQKRMFSPTQIVIGKCNVDKEEYDRLCEQLKTNGIACLPDNSNVQYLDEDWVLYEMPEK